jgi:hypothetical protein
VNEKSYNDHYEEFYCYCVGLTDNQLGNVIEAERERHDCAPNDECYAACYCAAKAVARERGLHDLVYG